MDRERHVKTRKPSRKNASVEALRVRYAELLRLRADVQRLESLWHDPDEPRDRYDGNCEVFHN